MAVGYNVYLVRGGAGNGGRGCIVLLTPITFFYVCLCWTVLTSLISTSGHLWTLLALDFYSIKYPYSNEAFRVGRKVLLIERQVWAFSKSYLYKRNKFATNGSHLYFHRYSCVGYLQRWEAKWHRILNMLLEKNSLCLLSF